MKSVTELQATVSKKDDAKDHSSITASARGSRPIRDTRLRSSASASSVPLKHSLLSVGAVSVIINVDIPVIVSQMSDALKRMNAVCNSRF